MRRSPSRWVLAVIAVVIQLCLGAGYSWTVFRKPIESAYGWSYAETAEPFRYLLLAYALGMTFGGWFQDHFGPRRVATLGGLLVTLGCAFGALFGTTPIGMSMGYATLCGLGMGFAYVSALAVLVKWFPDRRGLIVGIAVFGFGAGSMLSAPTQTWLIGSNPALFRQTIPLTFWWMSAVFFAVIVGLSTFLINPEASQVPPSPQSASDVKPQAMLRTWQFYSLWVIMFASTLIGLCCLSEAAPYLKKLTVSEVGFAVGLMGLANGLGRLAVGTVSDRIGRKAALVSVFTIHMVACGGFLASPSSFLQGFLGMCLAAFAFGAGIACMPAICADYFGSKHLGTNYGLLFTGFAVSGFFGPTVVSAIVQSDPSNGYRLVFSAFVLLAGTGGALAVLLRRPAALC